MYTARERSLIIWIGPDPPPAVAAEFTTRGLNLASASAANVPSLVPTARALVCIATSGDCPEVVALFEHCQNAVLSGLQLFIVPSDTRVSRAIQERIHQTYTTYFRGRPDARLPFQLVSPETLTSSPCALAESCTRWDAGPPPNQSLAIPLSSADSTLQLLLQRAFNDCRNLTMEPLGGGYSARVFKVHATFERRRLVDLPVPYYAKFDRLQKIGKELTNYEELVEAAVPFNLRPNPDYRRCIREGYTHGLIVGNFVEQSEPLWQTARRGQSGPAIFSLFDQAFKSWRLSSYCELKESLVFRLEEQGIRIQESQFRTSVLELASKLGLKSSVSDLAAALRSLAPQPYRKGTIHGDLNVENVRTHGADPVLIDFYSVRPSAPLAYDPATLEVSLAFRKYGPKDVDSDWRKTIETLYQPEHFLRPPEPALRSDRREWLWNAIRHIRMIGLAAEESTREYQTAVCFALLSRLRHPASQRYTEYRFAIGLLAAEKLLTDLEEHQLAKTNRKNSVCRNR